MSREKFEDALKKLEDILRKLETGDMTLEESLKAFEEGIKLSRFCSDRLDEAEGKVEILLKEDGKITEKPFAREDSEA